MPELHLNTPLDLNKLPLVLAGPILRRVEPNQVSVWLALKSPGDVTLTVLDDQHNPASVRMQGSVTIAAGALVTTGEVRLGANLAIVCVTATLAAGAPALAPGQLYYYRIGIGGLDLGQPGILTLGGDSTLSSISYPGNILPSFCLPSDQVGSLRIAYASCRKPHAESLDALLALDAQLRATATTAVGRPQQLVLMGDQIYADDVADVLLAVLTDAGDTLLGAEEILPPTSVGLKGKALVPGKRNITANQACGFSTQACFSHLLTFAEFSAMYLLSFSDVPWPATLPTFEELFPPGDNKGIYTTQTRTFKGHTTTTITNPIYARYLEQTNNLASFKKSLPRVRQVLANIATYMICDDHEITDDWYMNRSWMNQVLANTNAQANPALSSRVIQNGLAAYALFQHWGNRPSQLGADSNWSSFLAAASQWIKAGFPASSTDVTTLTARLAVPTTAISAQNTELDRTNSLLWSYAIRWSIHELLVVDTRTRRGYPEKFFDEPVLLTSGALAMNTIGAATDFSEICADLASSPALPANGVTVIVLPSPIVGIPFIEGVKRDGLSNATTTFDRDVESMDISAAVFDGLLTGLARRAPARTRIVMLTGDVHFGYAAGIQHWLLDANGNATAQIAVANITSSALKNQQTDGLNSTVRLHENGYGVIRKIDAPAPKTRFTWAVPSPTGSNPAPVTLFVGQGRATNKGTSTPQGDIHADVDLAYPNALAAAIPDVDELTTFFSTATLLTRPRSVTTTVLVPVDGGADRGVSLPTVPVPSVTDKNLRAANVIVAQNNAITNALVAAAGRQIVGTNNIGVLTFTADAGGAPTGVVQELWWWLDKAAVLLSEYLGSASSADPPPVKPYSHFTVPFTFGTVRSTNVLK